MTPWSNDELTRIGRADELQIASRRNDRTLRPFVTIWAVRVGEDIYVRSARGVDNPWFIRAKASVTGRIRAGGIERDVDFAEPITDAAAIDQAYHAKYDRYGPTPVGFVVGDTAAPATLRLVPSGRRLDA